MTILTIEIPDQKVAAVKRVLKEMGATAVIKTVKKEPELPNAETIKAINELKAGKGKRFKSVDALFESIR
jgi:antitoxin component of RelBE/YafQ-DinJ toxin-antitoxin module